MSALRPRVAAVIVFVVALVALAAIHSDPPLPLPAPVAQRSALKDTRVNTALRGSGWDRVRVTRVDDRLDRVSFFAGTRLVFDAGVSSDGRVLHAADFAQPDVGYGARISHELPVLLAMFGLFIAATLVLPLRHVRNLEVLALASFGLGVVLLDRRELEAFTLLAVPPLVFLAIRCAWVAFRPAPAAPSVPLLTSIVARDEDGSRRRLLRLAVAAAALVYLMVCVSSNRVVDVGYASMAGATDLLHGVLPYGHLPSDVVHGDTYPLLAYASYVPLALLGPVRDAWDSLDGALWLAAGATVVTAVALARGAGGGPGEGTRLAFAWLVFPPLLVTASSGTNDLILAALLALVLLATRRHGVLAVILLVVAAWVKVLPVLLLPLWLARLRGRELRLALAGTVAVSLANVGVLVALGGPRGVGAMLHGIAFQWQRQSLHTLWSWIHVPGGQVVVQAATLGLLAAGTVAVRRRPTLAGDPARLAALAAAVLIGLQLGANYWAYLYLSWLFPCVAWALLRPTGAVRVPASVRVPIRSRPVPVPPAAVAPG